MYLIPPELRALKSFSLSGIRNVIRVPTKRSKLPTSPLPHRLSHRRIVMVREILKRRRSCKLLTLEEQRKKRCSQHNSRSHLRAVHSHSLLQPLARRPIANLVVVLDEPQEAMRRQSLHRPALSCR